MLLVLIRLHTRLFIQQKKFLRLFHKLLLNSKARSRALALSILGLEQYYKQKLFLSLII